MKKSFTLTLQSNQGVSPKVAFVVSSNKAQKIINLINPEIEKTNKRTECSSIKLDQFFS